MDPVRCPYCAEGNEFKIMIARATHFVCEKCGHTAVPVSLTYECPCPKCKELKLRG